MSYKKSTYKESMSRFGRAADNVLNPHKGEEFDPKERAQVEEELEDEDVEEEFEDDWDDEEEEVWDNEDDEL